MVVLCSRAGRQAGLGSSWLQRESCQAGVTYRSAVGEQRMAGFVAGSGGQILRTEAQPMYASHAAAVAIPPAAAAAAPATAAAPIDGRGGGPAALSACTHDGGAGGPLAQRGGTCRAWQELFHQSGVGAERLGLQVGPGLREGAAAGQLNASDTSASPNPSAAVTFCWSTCLMVHISC